MRIADLDEIKMDTSFIKGKNNSCMCWVTINYIYLEYQLKPTYMYTAPVLRISSTILLLCITLFS
jgi:hypothetical protein